jgi:phage shock protein PspC (stress-responsive transcriptional regulator)
MDAMSSLWTVRRSTADSKVAGVCGGLARLWGVDPVLIRVGFAVLALSGGIGIVLYLAGWMLVPADGRATSPLYEVLGQQARGWPREVWIVIVAACCILTYALLRPVTPFGFGPAVVLALIWYFGYYRHRSPEDRSTRILPPGVEAPAPATQPLQFYSFSGPPTPFTEAATAWRERIESASRAAQPPAAPSMSYQSTTARAEPADAPEDLREPVGPAAQLPPAQPFGAESVTYHAFLATPDPAGIYAETGPVVAARATAPVKRHATPSARRLRLVAVMAVGLTLSGLAAADAVGVTVPVAAYFAATLLILGLTLVAAARWGRARGILPVAILVMLATLGSTVSGPVAAEHGWGVEQVRYTTPAELARGDTQVADADVGGVDHQDRHGLHRPRRHRRPGGVDAPQRQRGGQLAGEVGCLPARRAGGPGWLQPERGGQAHPAGPTEEDPDPQPVR